MITAIRVEGAGESPAEIQRELDTLLDHMMMIGSFEGIVPSGSTIPEGGEVYPRCHPSVSAAAGGYEFTGRKVLHFELGETPHPNLQDEFEVREKTFAFAGDVATPATYTAAGGSRDVTAETIVVWRRLPMDWPDTVRMPALKMIESSRPPKPEQADLNKFTELAMREEVDEISYGIVDGGYAVEVRCLLPDPASPGNAFGWLTILHGETLYDAAAAAIADTDARVAEYRESGTGTLDSMKGVFDATVRFPTARRDQPSE